MNRICFILLIASQFLYGQSINKVEAVIGNEIVLTSDRPPSKLTRIQERIRSRFSGGLVVDIQNPDLNLRSEIVKSKLELKKFIKLKKFKNNKNNLSIQNPKNLALNFVNKFDQHIKKNSKTKKIFFSRHKKTKINKNIFLGQKLNAKIIDKKNHKEFIKIKFNKCYSSPAKRCLDTAKIVCKNKKIITNNYLKEIDYGEAEGLNFNQLNEKYSYITESWKKGLDPKFPNGESMKDVSRRLNKFINNEIKSKLIKKNNSYLIFTHNVLLRCLVGNYFSINKKDWFKININYFDLLEFKLENGKLISNIDRNKYLSIFKNFY